MSYGSPQTIVATNLNSAGNGTLIATPAVTLSVVPHDLRFQIKITLGSSGVGSAGTVTVYLASSINTSDGYTDGIDPTSGSDQISKLKNLMPLKNLVANANDQIVNDTIDLRQIVGSPPENFCLVFLNSTSAAFASTGHSIKYQTLGY